MSYMRSNYDDSSTLLEIKTKATKAFDAFFAAESVSNIIRHFDDVKRAIGGLQSGKSVDDFYSKLKMNLASSTGSNLFKILDERIKSMSETLFGPHYQSIATAQHVENDGLKVMVVGCGPCGLRMAIECQLMSVCGGSRVGRVVAIEKRSNFTRNNVLHIWPFVIDDLKRLGVKVFYPKFCSGTMNHMSIRRLQVVLLKVALVLGVEIRTDCCFVKIIEPKTENKNWTIQTERRSSGGGEFELDSEHVDTIVCAEGKHVTVPGFQRKEFRGKLAIAITANFVNTNTTAEAIVEEISGIAFVYKQDFFNNLYDELGIALENIVYYKDETHYFVMTSKKHSLLDRGVLKKDLRNPVDLLAPENVNKDALVNYIRDTCDYCTDYQLPPDLPFALNESTGGPDVAMFDFTSMFASKNSMRVEEKYGRQLLCLLVGDGLTEPFWPTGTGCARGFLGVFDACWTLKRWTDFDFRNTNSLSVSQIMSEREGLYKMLPQTTPQNLNKEYKRYSIDPSTRYNNSSAYNITGEIGLASNTCSSVTSGYYESDCPSNGNSPPLFTRKRVTSNDLILSPSKISESRPDRLNSLRSDNSYRLTANDAHTRQRISTTNQRDPFEYDYTTTNAKEDEQVVKPCPDYILGRDNERRNSSYVNSSNTSSNRFEDRNLIDSTTRRKSTTTSLKLRESKRENGVMLGVKILKHLTSNTKNDIHSNSKVKNDDCVRGNSIKNRELLNSRRVSDQCHGDRRDLFAQTTSVVFPTSSSLLIDSELEIMLKQLESDPSFQRLTDNEKMGWLESLFYQDSKNSNVLTSNILGPSALREEKRQGRLNFSSNKILEDESNQLLKFKTRDECASVKTPLRLNTSSSVTKGEEDHEQAATDRTSRSSRDKFNELRSNKESFRKGEQRDDFAPTNTKFSEQSKNTVALLVGRVGDNEKRGQCEKFVNSGVPKKVEQNIGATHSNDDAATNKNGGGVVNIGDGINLNSNLITLAQSFFTTKKS